MNLIACLDVHYADPRAAAACIVLSSWQASAPEECVVRTIDNVKPYEAGAFYKRELPCIEEVLKALRHVPEILVVDGYVWLGQGKKGLGAYLFEARGSVGAVVGIAKTRFIGAEPVGEVFRGQSRRPLFVSAVGMDLAEACARVEEMHGKFRVRWAVSEVDRVAREHLVPKF
jgi:deoxyribonuclease V